jgi:D-glycero-D-manno-heptose 1,7-bisphosphate phosphatase
VAVTRAGLFLDKDGTLIHDVPYNVDPAHIRFMPGATHALARLHAAGFAIVVVSNQAGVALGRFQEAELEAVEQALCDGLAAGGVPLTGVYWCPHHPEGAVPRYTVHCECRKPLPGLLRRAASEHDIDLAVSWMVGDILDDVEAGRRAGCRTVLLDSGNETQWRLSPMRLPHLVAEDLERAADAILAARSRVAAVAGSRCGSA